MLRAYCDASELRSGVFSIAGVAFGVDRAKKATRDFEDLFGVGRICHMTDLHNRRKEFAGIGDEEAYRLCRGAVEIINRRATLIAVASCDIGEVARLAPRSSRPDAELLQEALSTSYSCCMHWLMHVMGSMLARDASQRMHYWFELGDEHQGIARRFLSELSSPMLEPLRRSYAYGESAFVAARDARLFEAADLVAWEWGRHVDGVRAGRCTRKSLAALMGGPCVHEGHAVHNSVGRYARHLSGQVLVRYFGKMGAVVNATSHEEVSAAVASNAWD